MATSQYELSKPPSQPRARELWLQHAAAFIVFEDVRRYAIERIDPALPSDVRAAVEKGIDDAVYGLMMIMDGVTGTISSASRSVHIDFVVRLAERADSQDDAVLAEVDLRNGDGMCMGYHGWREGDFGADPIAVPAKKTDAASRAKK